MSRNRAAQSHRRAHSLIEGLEQRMLLAADVTIDAGTRYQTIDGFGSALAFWLTSPYNQTAWQNMYYQDLGSSMLRVDMRASALEGSDGNWLTPVTLGTDLAANIAQFDFTAYGVPVFGTTAQAGQNLKLDQLKVVASIWTPPHWMKGAELDPWSGQPNGNQPVVNGMDSSGGTLIDTTDNLAQFGRYVASWVAGFEQYYGVQIYSVSLQNELALHTAYSSCVYTPALFAKAVKAAGEAFAMWGLDTKIQGPEYMSIGGASEPWQIYHQRQYIDAIKADPAAYAALDSYVTHNYPSNGSPDGRSVEMWDQFWNGRTNPPYTDTTWAPLKNDGRKLWMTETSGEAATWDGAMLLASKTQEALIYGNVSAWLYWQTSDSGAAGSYNLTNASDTTADKYVSQKHFYRYIRPDSVRISATPIDPNGVEVSAFVQDQQKTLTTVLVNRSSTSQVVNLNLDNIDVSSFGVYRQSVSGTKWADMGPLTVVGGNVTITLPAKSIVTLQGAQTPGFIASADAYVKGGISASQNFGGDSILWVKEDTDPSYDRHAYLRFDLDRYTTTVSSANLKLPVVAVGADVGAMSIQVRLVATDTWTESGITWNTRPATSTVLATIAGTSLQAGNIIQIDLTGAVNDAINTDKKLSIALVPVNAAGSNRWVNFGSRENATLANRPRLAIVNGIDAYVKGGSSASTNYGSDVTMMVKEDIDPLYDRQAYMQFDLGSHGAAISSATLKLPVVTVGTDVAAMSIQVRLVSNDQWFERGITWNNRPASSTVLATIAGSSLVAGGAIQLDLTSAVNDAINGDKRLSIALVAVNAAGSNRYVNFGSRENATLANRPTLAIVGSLTGGMSAPAGATTLASPSLVTTQALSSGSDATAAMLTNGKRQAKASDLLA